MEWLEQNIDAYRIVAEVLAEIRSTLKRGLEKIYGNKWYRDGLPEGLLDRIVAVKEQEQAIDWYETEYEQIMDYAVFPDLLEILEANAANFPEIMSLAPSPALLHARFLELEVMRAKLGRTRPISETELSFLGTFHLRFRKAMAEARESVESGEFPKVVPPQTTASEDLPEDEVSVEVDDNALQADDQEEIVVVEVTEEEEEVKEENMENEKPSGPPRRQVQTFGEEKEISDNDTQPVVESTHNKEEEPEIVAKPSKSFGVSPKKLSMALADNDHGAILRELYREVTAIAEGIWTSEIIPAPMVWERVTASEWYELNFSRLGLQPLSDFYKVIAKVDKKITAGVPKDEVQDFLKEANFAKNLLALRDMFQTNNI